MYTRNKIFGNKCFNFLMVQHQYFLSFILPSIFFLPIACSILYNIKIMKKERSILKVIVEQLTIQLSANDFTYSLPTGTHTPFMLLHEAMMNGLF